MKMMMTLAINPQKKIQYLMMMKKKTKNPTKLLQKAVKKRKKTMKQNLKKP